MNIPHQLGYFRIEAYLGSGRYTDVFRAVDPVRRRTLALKLLKVDRLADAIEPSTLLTEARRAADLVHPHIAWVWEAGELEGRFFLAERFINGPSAAQMIRKSGPLPVDQAISAIYQTALALDFAHAKGWVHGDVKPANILISSDHGAALTDIGLSFALWTTTTPSEYDLAEGKALPGTPEYQAPEVWRGKLPDAASDQYSLACTLVEMLTGQSLFFAPTLAEIRANHLSPPDLLSLPLPWFFFRRCAVP